MTTFQPRPAQEDVLSYQGGTMGVAAVPGSGKTWTLSLLAASCIERGLVADDQEILVVTLVNSAVDNFSRRISHFLGQRDLIPTLGYRVRTLHGLAHDIIRERPELVGLDTQFSILDERETERIRRKAVRRYLHDHPHTFQPFWKEDLTPSKLEWIQAEHIPDLLYHFSLQFIRTSKDQQLTPSDIETALQENTSSFPLVQIGLDIYREYQESLSYRGAVDFDDLIQLAHQALHQDPAFLHRLRRLWPIILEDEAQDSSQMQENILRTLSGPPPENNWVRVGDPNQAIYETFTTADPRLLLKFIDQADQQHTLPNSGRSTASIIDLANHLVSWVNHEHPRHEVRNALAENHIQPTPPDDIQANPQDRPDQVHLIDEKYSPAEELQIVGASAARWIKSHPEKTAAVLVPRNHRGQQVASYLRREHGLEPVEKLNTTLTTRQTAGALGNILEYLSHPSSTRQFARLFLVWNRDQRENSQAWDRIEEISRLLENLERPENFLYPGPEAALWPPADLLNSEEHAELTSFKEVVHRWLEAVLLPIDQLLLTISADLFETSSELAIAHKLAYFLGQLAADHPDWDLPALTDELRVLARNERRFFSFTSEAGFDPDHHQGKIMVTTAHKSKGLEWDRVYIMSVNNYNFPSGQPFDSYISEKWFIRDRLNLPAEGAAQLRDLMRPEASPLGEASREARLDYVRERLRLLYVAVTRAREEFVITWNTGKRGNALPALPLLELIEYWKNHPSHPHN